MEWVHPSWACLFAQVNDSFPRDVAQKMFTGISVSRLAFTGTPSCKGVWESAFASGHTDTLIKLDFL